MGERKKEDNSLLSWSLTMLRTDLSPLFLPFLCLPLVPASLLSFRRGHLLWLRAQWAVSWHRVQQVLTPLTLAASVPSPTLLRSFEPLFFLLVPLLLVLDVPS